jgi:hypothetical protein
VKSLYIIHLFVFITTVVVLQKVVKPVHKFTLSIDTHFLLLPGFTKFGGQLIFCRGRVVGPGRIYFGYFRKEMSIPDLLSSSRTFVNSVQMLLVLLCCDA